MLLHGKSCLEIRYCDEPSCDLVYLNIMYLLLAYCRCRANQFFDAELPEAAGR